MQLHFTSLVGADDDFSILESAQMEPADSTDPDEIMQMWYTGDANVVFDAIFYPAWVEIQDFEDDTHLGIIRDSEVSNARELKAKLRSILL